MKGYCYVVKAILKLCFKIKIKQNKIINRKNGKIASERSY